MIHYTGRNVLSKGFEKPAKQETNAKTRILFFGYHMQIEYVGTKQT